MAERFENLDNILRGWGKEKIQKSLVGALNRYEKRKEGIRNRFFFKEMIQKKYSSSLSRHSSEIKSKTKLVSKINFKVRNHCLSRI